MSPSTMVVPPVTVMLPLESIASEPVTMTMRTAEGYRFTAEAAVSSVERILGGSVAPGAWTPSRAFGAGFAEAAGAVLTG